MNLWKSVLELDSKREIKEGSTGELCKSINNAADLRIQTLFFHNEHSRWLIFLKAVKQLN